MPFFKPVARFFFGGGQSLKKFISDLSKIYSINNEDSLIFAADNMIKTELDTGDILFMKYDCNLTFSINEFL